MKKMDMIAPLTPLFKIGPTFIHFDLSKNLKGSCLYAKYYWWLCFVFLCIRCPSICIKL